MFARLAARLWLVACSAALLAAAPAAPLSAHPRREIPPPANSPPPPPQPIPDLAGECTYGKLTQVGRMVWIEPDAGQAWQANGRILTGGAIVLEWVYFPDARAAVSVYRYDPKTKTLAGAWGWASEAKVDRAGKLTGKTQPSSIVFYAPIPPKD